MTLISDGPDPGTVGLYVFFSAFALAAYDLWFPLRRPAAACGQNSTEIKSSLLPTFEILLGAVGLGLMSISLIDRYNAGADLDGRGAGLVLVFGLPFAAGLLLFGFGQLVLPDTVRLTKGHLRSRLLLRTREFAWDEIDSISLKGDPGNGGLVLRRKGSATEVILLRLYLVEPTFDQLKPWLEFYRDNPASRDELGTQASIDRLNSFGAGSWWANPR